MMETGGGRRPVDPAVRERDLDEAVARLKGSGVAISSEIRAALAAFGDLVIDRSAVYNLISPADRARFFTRHVSESLTGALIEKAAEAGSLVDIGSGAGLPGIPLALAVPGLRALLVEPRLRKAQFLEMAAFRLGIADRVEVFQGTAEALGRRSEGSLAAGLATARAVSRLEDVWTWSQDLLRPGGWLATWKGPDEAGSEAGALRTPAPTDIEIHPIAWAQRALLLIRKG